MTVEFFVPGRPRPKGSLRAMTSKSTGRAIMIESGDAALRKWMTDIKIMAADSWCAEPTSAAVQIKIVFQFVQPKKSRAEHTVRPDWDKLSRAVCDALTGIIYVDDSQVVKADIEKRYDAVPGATIGIKI